MGVTKLLNFGGQMGNGRSRERQRGDIREIIIELGVGMKNYSRGKGGKNMEKQGWRIEEWNWDLGKRFVHIYLLRSIFGLLDNEILLYNFISLYLYQIYDGKENSLGSLSFSFFFSLAIQLFMI